MRVASSSSSRSASRPRSTALSSASSAAISRRVADSMSEKGASGAAEPLTGRSFILDDADLGLRPPPAANPAFRQALRKGSLRGGISPRNAAAKLCTRKQPIWGRRRWTGGTGIAKDQKGAASAGSSPRCARSQAFHSTRILIMTQVDHTRMANAIRGLSMDAVEKAKSGHPGLPMGCADIATVLFTQFLKYDAAKPDWPDRDRFVLSAGHGSMLLYSLLYLTGNSEMTLDQIKRFRQVD